MTSPTDAKRLEELIVDAKAIVADGDAYGTKAQHPTTIHTRQIIEKLAGALTSIKAERDRLREAVEIIAGKRQSLDNLMSNEDVALSALKEGDSRS
jgi:hypothetical protein